MNISTITSSLPPTDIKHDAQYGALYIAAKYCGLQQEPYTIEGEWQHGWIWPERNVHPEWVIGSAGTSFSVRKKCTFFVAREDQVNYLGSHGYRKVYAIGLPIIYVPRPVVQRIPDSLLVMPIHSLPETSEDWTADAEYYAQYIHGIRDRFRYICICVHPSCLEKGNWVNAFQSYGFDILAGANKSDRNALLRMATIISQFEYLTSNDMGSHIAYGSFFACKVSVAGPIPSHDRKYYENLTLYRNAPELLDILVEMRSSNAIRNAYPQFYCEPWKAKQHEEWAAWQLGLQHKLSPDELQHLLGWNWKGKIRYTLLRICRLCLRIMGIPKYLY